MDIQIFIVGEYPGKGKDSGTENPCSITLPTPKNAAHGSKKKVVKYGRRAWHVSSEIGKFKIGRGFSATALAWHGDKI
jgi:hypothetical protein